MEKFFYVTKDEFVRERLERKPRRVTEQKTPIINSKEGTDVSSNGVFATKKLKSSPLIILVTASNKIVTNVLFSSN